MIKYQFLSLFLIFFVNSNAQTQPKLVQSIRQIWIADSTKWRNSERTTYEYEGDFLTYQLREYWFTGREDWGNKEGITSFYDENGQLEKQILNSYQAGTDDYENLYTNTYQYNENGCLVAERNEVVSIHGQYPNYENEYTVDENCHVTHRLRKKLEITGDTTYQKNHYVNDADGKVKIDSQYALFNDVWQLHYERFFDYDVANRLIKKDEYLLFSSSTTREYETWEYDENGELMHRVKVRETNSQPYREISKDSITVQYDDQNRLAQRRTISYRFDTSDPPITERFKYYCGDVLKQLGVDDLPRIYRTSYEYDRGLDDDCINDLEDKSIMIFPNPAINEIIINSDLLSGEQTTIYIYDALGRQFLEQEFFILHNTLSIDISDLNRGMYFVTVENNDRVATEKLYVN